jgi:hypothetical protein
MRYSAYLLLLIGASACGTAPDSSGHGDHAHPVDAQSLTAYPAPADPGHDDGAVDSHESHKRSKQGTGDTDAEDFRRSCASEIDSLNVDAELGTLGESLDVVVPNRAGGRGDCTEFSWVRGFINTYGKIEARWTGPAITRSEWDCSHSSVEFGVYRKVAGAWEYVDGGLGFGSLESGTCTYSVRNFPEQSGADTAWVPATGVDAEGTEIRVALRSWSHNDPRMGHSGADCEGTSCYWPTRITGTGG